MIRKPETISFWRKQLPHWEVVDGLYFVTIHVCGAIGAALCNVKRSIGPFITKLRGVRRTADAKTVQNDQKSAAHGVILSIISSGGSTGNSVISIADRNASAAFWAASSLAA